MGNTESAATQPAGLALNACISAVLIHHVPCHYTQQLNTLPTVTPQIDPTTELSQWPRLDIGPVASENQT